MYIVAHVCVTDLDKVTTLCAWMTHSHYIRTDERTNTTMPVINQLLHVWTVHAAIQHDNLTVCTSGDFLHVQPGWTFWIQIMSGGKTYFYLSAVTFRYRHVLVIRWGSRRFSIRSSFSYLSRCVSNAESSQSHYCTQFSDSGTCLTQNFPCRRVSPFFSGHRKKQAPVATSGCMTRQLDFFFRIISRQLETMRKNKSLPSLFTSL